MRYILCSCIILLFFFPGCRNENSIDLGSSWKVSCTDPFDNIGYTSNGKAKVKVINIPYTPDSCPENNTLFLYRKIPAQLLDSFKEPALFLGRIWSSDRAYFNGVRIGSTGSIPPKYSSTWNVNRYYVIPKELIKINEDNVLMLRIVGQGTPRLRSEPFIAELRYIESYVLWNNLLNSYLAFLTGALTFIIGLFSLFSYFITRNKILRDFTFISIIWACLSTHFFVSDFVINFALKERIYYFLLQFEIVLIYFFLEKILNLKIVINRVLIIISSFVLLLLLFFGNVIHPFNTDFHAHVAICALIDMALMSVLIFRALRNRVPHSAIIAGGFVIFLMGIIHDGLAAADLIYENTYLMSISYPSLVFALGLILLKKAKIVVRKLEIADELAEEKQRLSTTLSSIGDGLITTDINGRIELYNRIAEEITGMPVGKATAMPIDQVMQLYDQGEGQKRRNPVYETIETGETVILDSNVILKDVNANEKYISAAASSIRDSKNQILGAVLIFRDITEHKKLHQELLKQTKIESLGVFAGGIAHDFNNLLAAILGNASIAKLNLKNSPIPYELISDIEKITFQARGLTNQLLTFSKGGAPVKQSTSIKTLLKETSAFVMSGSKSRLNFKIFDELWQARVDKSQINQVIHNIMLNARQALPDGGKITVSAVNCIIKEDREDLAAGKYIKIIIEDTGCGISETIIDKIFDPFFSTKENGSGLGLSVSYSIIKKHYGAIEVNSVIGKGTKFIIFLPACADSAPCKTEPPALSFFDGGSVLLMDDEEMILKVVSKMLKNLGFQITCVKNGEEAVDIYRLAMIKKEPFDIVIMDLTIPGGIGGKEAIGLLREVDPNVKAIVSSGYSQDPVMANFQEYGFKGVAVKPYNSEELAQVLTEVLCADELCFGKIV